MGAFADGCGLCAFLSLVSMIAGLCLFSKIMFDEFVVPPPSVTLSSDTTAQRELSSPAKKMWGNLGRFFGLLVGLLAAISMIAGNFTGLEAFGIDQIAIFAFLAVTFVTMSFYYCSRPVERCSQYFVQFAAWVKDPLVRMVRAFFVAFSQRPRRFSRSSFIA